MVLVLLLAQACAPGREREQRRDGGAAAVPPVVSIVDAAPPPAAPAPPPAATPSLAARAPKGVPALRLVGTARTGSLPKGVVVTPDGASLFVTNFGRIRTSNLFVYRAAPLAKAGEIAFEGNGVEMAATPDGARLLVSNFRRHVVLELDAAAGAVLREYPVGKNPKTIALSRDGARAYVSNWSSDGITALDLAAGSVIGSVRTGDQPRGIAVSPDGKTVYVANCAGGTLSFVDAASLAVTKTLRLDRWRTTLPRHVAVSPDGAEVYVTAQLVATLYVVDAARREVAARIRTGAGPKTVGLTPDGTFAFTANFSAHSITAINLASRESRTYRYGKTLRRPCGLAVSPDGRRLYVTGWENNVLAELEIVAPGG